jgi:uncharacterized repeat protein (TIGR01451 family)
MKQHRAFPVLLLALALCLVAIAGAQLSEHYDLSWNALGGGGGGAMGSSSYTMSGTAGQIIGLSGSGTYQLGAGYETVLTSAPVIHVNKTVRDPVNGTWVKDLTTASINDTLRFSCTITNTGTSNLSNLTQLRFWDVLDCSLAYAGNATLKDASGTEHAITLPCAPEEYCFKQKVLHNNTSWDPYAPLGTEFQELCPGVGNQYVLDQWEDTTNDSRLSAGDQINMTTMPGAWYHVDNVPYTLNVTAIETGESSHLDSVLDYEAIALSTPTHTEWVEVCGCKDECTVESWADDGDLNLSANDTILLRNARTGEAAEYTVADVTIDLVVSTEWEIDELWGDSLTLEPNESVRIEYNATVLRCGVDRNTFRAKGMVDGESNWTYSNEDFVSITVPCPSGDAADDSGSVKYEFLTGEDVYAVGGGFAPGTHVDIYIVKDCKWVGGEPITNYTVDASAPNVLTDGDGNIGVDTPIVVWQDPVPGEYDMVFDANQNEVYNEGIDAVDHPNQPGFSVNNPANVIRAPLLAPLGLAALVGLLSLIATSTQKGRRRKR